MVASSPSSIDRIERPTAPYDLTDEETEVWAAVVDSMPADWFRPENLPLLSQYARHVVQARRIAEWIERATSDESLKVRDYDRLLKLQARESAVIASLSVKMRLSQSTTRNDRGNDRAPAMQQKPWET